MSDEAYIKRTLLLASKAGGRTSPNPMVGAVIVRNNRIVAEDYHRKPGTPHAEALVIKKAGPQAAASTLYINLEPCCHTDKRTPPCTKAIISSGIRTVIIAASDPNPKVSGKGIQELKKAGIEVRAGILEEKARKLNEAYIKYITTKKPFVILKVAMTLDGKIATPEGQSRWITGEKARQFVHRMRNSVDAVMTAIGTVKADDPALTARVLRGARNPRKIIVDPKLEIPLKARLFQSLSGTIIVTAKNSTASNIAKIDKLNNLYKSNINFIFFKDKLDLGWLMKKLGEKGITSLMLEGGSSLNAYALEHGIVDKVIFMIAPRIMAGRDSYPAVGGKTFRKLEETYNLKDAAIKKLGDDFLIEGYL